MKHGRWYAKLAICSAICGAAMELFMIKTGFYEKVTAIEAERRAELQAAQATHEAIAPALPLRPSNHEQH